MKPDELSYPIDICTVKYRQNDNGDWEYLDHNNTWQQPMELDEGEPQAEMLVRISDLLDEMGRQTARLKELDARKQAGKTADELGQIAERRIVELEAKISKLNGTISYMRDINEENIDANAHKADRIAELKDALLDYGSHEYPCLLSQYSAGRPTDHGYELKYGGKWYPKDSLPKCTCGFDDVLQEKGK